MLRNLIDSELHPMEKVLWTSAPSTARMARKAIPSVLFGIPWTAFAVFWMAGASGFQWPNFNDGMGLFPLFGIPFVLVGLGMLSAPFWAARKATATAYAITNQRAIIFSKATFGGFNVQSFAPRQLGNIRRVQFADGSGDLILSQKTTTNSNGDARGIDIGFFGIPDVQKVESMVVALTAD